MVKYNTLIQGKICLCRLLTFHVMMDTIALKPGIRLREGGKLGDDEKKHT
jgi:hypothetical protein